MAVGVTISELNAASTPLDGTELLELEKDNSSVQVSVSNLITGGSLFSLSDVDPDPDADRIAFWDDSDGALEWAAVSTGLSLAADGTLTTDDSQIDHDALNNFVANEHIDWTSNSGNTIDDSNLSSNVALLDQDNTFESDSTIFTGSSFGRLSIEESGEAVDEKLWALLVNDSDFRIIAYTDGFGSPGDDAIRINRGAGATVDAVNFPNGELQYGGVEVTSSSGTTGGSGSAGSGNQYIELNVGGTVYRVLHDGTV